MATHDYEAIGRAVVLIASLFGSAAPLAEAPASKGGPKPKAETPAPVPTETSTAEASPTTPAPPKGEGNSKNLTGPEFSKWGLTTSATFGDNGATAKAVLARFKTAEGAPCERFSSVQPSDYDAFIEAFEQAAMS